MTEVWRQISAEFRPEEPVDILMWNLRGRAVGIEVKQIEELLRRGFSRCADGTKIGDYNPIYDRGVGKVEAQMSQMVTAQANVGDYLKTIII